MIFIVTEISELPYAVASGFELNWIQVLGLYLVITALIYFYVTKNNRLINGMLLIALLQLVGLIYSRYQNITNENLFLIPGNQPLSIVRHN
jgi:formate-dependent nitrite reductase membrane component NrfD